MSEPDKLPCTVYRLRMATRRATRLYDRMLAPSGLGIAQFGLLQLLCRSSGASVTDLALALDMDRTTMTRNLMPLARRGLITLGPGRDRRSRAVAITDEGRAAVARALPLWRKAQGIVRETLGGDDLERLHALLDVASERIPTD